MINKERKEEIKNLKQEIKDKKISNLKTSGIRNFKMTAKALEIIGPYVLTAGIVAGAFTLGKATPFYRDNIEAHSVTLTEYDEVGNSKTSQRYESNRDISKTKDKSNEIVCYSKWYQNSNGSYSRDKEIYSFDNEAINDILELFGKNEQEIRQVLDEKCSFIMKREETSKELKEEELKKDFTFTAKVCIEDKNDFIVREEEVGTNVASTIIYFLITLSIESGVFYLKYGLEGESFYDVVCVKNQYKKIDLTELKAKLKQKKLEYKI